MGYCMTQRDGVFHLPQCHFKAAVGALMKLPESICGRVTTEQAESLPRLLLALGWEVEQEAQTGDIVCILFAGEKAHEDYALFKALAPFVRKDSFIAMEGEDGCLWRWWFNGRTVREQSGLIIYI